MINAARRSGSAAFAFHALANGDWVDTRRRDESKLFSSSLISPRRPTLELASAVAASQQGPSSSDAPLLANGRRRAFRDLQA